MEWYLPGQLGLCKGTCCGGEEIVVGESWSDWRASRDCEKLLQELATPIGPDVSTLQPTARKFVLSVAAAGMAMRDDTRDRKYNNRGTQM